MEAAIGGFVMKHLPAVDDATGKLLEAFYMDSSKVGGVVFEIIEKQ